MLEVSKRREAEVRGGYERRERGQDGISGLASSHLAHHAKVEVHQVATLACQQVPGVRVGVKVSVLKQLRTEGGGQRAQWASRVTGQTNKK